jgi:hypothetical protein
MRTAPSRAAARRAMFVGDIRCDSGVVAVKRGDNVGHRAAVYSCGGQIGEKLTEMIRESDRLHRITPVEQASQVV